MNETRVKDIDWDHYETQCKKLSKEQLIKFINKKSERSKRDLEKKIEIEKREKNVVDSYVSMLSSILPTYEDDVDTKRGKIKNKYFDDSQSKQKQITIFEKEIKDLENKIQEVRKPKNECYGKKKEAQNKITKKMVQKTYKYFETKSSEIPVKLMEIYIGALRNHEKGSREDVELYIKNHKGLVVSMNKLEESKLNREFAKVYADGLKDLKEPITEKEYAHLIPIYVWMDNVMKIVKYGIEEKHLRQDVTQKEDAIFKLKHDIDRNQIILDHLGIDPNEYHHMNNLVEFWRKHLIDLQKHFEDDKEDLNTWDQDHSDELHDRIKKHRDENADQADMRIDYPVFGETPVEPTKNGAATKLEDSKVDAENESDDEGDEASVEESDDKGDDEEAEESSVIESEDISVEV
jgi:hypothetical protein